jgi:hypothetical protein
MLKCRIYPRAGGWVFCCWTFQGHVFLFEAVKVLGADFLALFSHLRLEPVLASSQIFESLGALLCRLCLVIYVSSACQRKTVIYIVWNLLPKNYTLFYRFKNVIIFISFLPRQWTVYGGLLFKLYWWYIQLIFCVYWQILCLCNLYSIFLVQQQEQ